jgi:hypothetical protein
MLADFYIFKYNRHCLQSFEVNVSSFFFFLSLKFSAGSNVITLCFIGNNPEHVVALKVKIAIVC